MLAIINNVPIDSTLFRNCCINEDLNMISFIHRPKSMAPEVHLNIIFEEKRAAGRFFFEYHRALYEGEDTYRFEGKATFLNDLYVRILVQSEEKQNKYMKR